MIALGHQVLDPLTIVTGMLGLKVKLKEVGGAAWRREHFNRTKSNLSSKRHLGAYD